MAFIARQALRMSPSSSSSPSRIASTRLAALSRHMSSQSGTPGRSELDRSKNDIAARKALESLMVVSRFVSWQTPLMAPGLGQV